MTMDRDTRAAVNAAAKRAAEEAVKRTFLTLGVDVSTAHEVKELQQDFILLRQQRLAIGNRGKYWVLAFTTGLTVLGTLLGWTGQKLLGSFFP